MSITVDIPGSMRRFTCNKERVEITGVSTVGDVLRRLVKQFPKLHNSLFTKDDELFAYVGIFLNRQDIRGLQMETTPVSAGDQITLLPAVAGG